MEMSSIIKRIRPGKSNMENVERTVTKINKALEKAELKAECVVGGSFAKDTHLKGDYDVDLFVRFDREHKDDNISNLLEKVLPFKSERIPGSRDYFQVERYGNMTFEIVPVLKVDKPEEAENVTDMSPLHVTYVNRQNKRKPGTNDQIRLAKQFAKANRVYGAESYIQGFSGHVLDLLVIYYGSFEKLLEASSKWGDRVVIDMESHWSNPLKELNRSKIQSPLVLVDPIQPERNAAAALSREKYELFRTRARQFLKGPDEDFFRIRDFDIEELEGKAGKDYLMIIRMWPYKDKDDVMGAKLRQVYEYLFMKLRDKKWPIKESDWEFDPGMKKGRWKNRLENQPQGLFYFIIDESAPDYIDRKGPPVSHTSDLKKFTKKHESTYVEGGRIYARITRRHSSPREHLESLVEHKYVQERVKKVEFDD